MTQPPPPEDRRGQTPPDENGPLRTFERIHRQMVQAHMATQQALADNHAAYLRASEIALRLAAGHVHVSAMPPYDIEDEPLILTSPVDAPAPAEHAEWQVETHTHTVPQEPLHDWMNDPAPIDTTPVAQEPPLPYPAAAHGEQMPADDMALPPTPPEPAEDDDHPAETLDHDAPFDAAHDTNSHDDPVITPQADAPLHDPEAPPPEGLPLPEAPAAPISTAATATPLRRLALVAHEETAPGHAMPGLRAGSRVLLMGGPEVIRHAVGQALTSAGLELVTNPAYLDALICLHGLTDNTGPHAAQEAALGAFAAAQSVAMHPPAVFIAVQNGGGDFALSGRSAARAWTAGFAAFTRTLAREWPNTATKTIDIVEPDPDRLAMRLTRELVFGGAEDMVALTGDNRRLVPREAELHAAANAPLMLPHDAVIVVSGGARGITAACLTALCTGRHLRLCLLGRTAYDPSVAADDGADSNQALRDRVLSEAQAAGRSLSPAELFSALGEIRAQREVRETMAQLSEAGAQIRYHAIDMTDAAAVNAAIARTREEFGRIDGVIHAAGIIADRRVADKTDQQFARVFATKVDGLANLLAATAEDHLSLLVMFASLAGRYGNLGQADYAIANATLSAVARGEALRRGPACLVKAIAWGPWDGGMLDSRLKSSFARHDVAAGEQASGAAAFLAELSEPAGDVVSTDIVLAPPATDFNEAAQTTTHDPGRMG